ncbi:MAG: AmmeMemoRadiSam system protein B [Bacteroidota bacterium]
MKTRKPAVDGSFYPSEKDKLNEEIIELINTEHKGFNSLPENKTLIGGIVPHAGIQYSGREAVHFFNLVKQTGIKYDTFVILHPDHSAYGPDIALDDNDYWETPLGKIEIDSSMENLLNIRKSAKSHEFEHSAEVMLPFLQYFLDYKFKILPVIIGRQNISNAKLVAGEVFRAAKELKRKILIIASSDFSHYVTPEYGERMDNLVINEISRFDSESIYKVVYENNISMCGYGPVMGLIEYSLLYSQNPEFKILRRGHSGEVAPMKEVVDYVCGITYCDKA